MATLVRWDPFREVAAMQNELNRFMNGLAVGAGRTSDSWVPAVDVWETDDELVYAFDAPGLEQDKIGVEVEDNTLTISAERERTQEVSEEKYHRFERRFGSFSRTVGLPQGVSEDDITAKYADGVLEVRVPKPAEAKPKRITVGADNGQATIEGSSTKK
jgi:HSP20 family protein